MHDHNDMTFAPGGSIDEMTLMWILMGLMAIHHAWMWWKMKKKKC